MPPPPPPLLLALLLLVGLRVVCADAGNVTRGARRGQRHSGNFAGRYELAGVRSFAAHQKAATRIIGGQEAWAHSWPWQVSLRLATMPACGGAVLAPLWVVSAAHCFKRYNKASFWTVLAGKHDLDDPDEEGQQVLPIALRHIAAAAFAFYKRADSAQVADVSAIVSHHRYRPGSKEFDVALLRLERALAFDRFVRPIRVWMAPLPTREKCTVTGWGATRENGPRVSRLQEVNVTVMTLDLCQSYYKSRIRTRMFCAGREAGGVDACQGDSGGPLSCYDGGRYGLAGVVSWGVGCGWARKPGVYTKLQEHAAWIADVIENQDVAYDLEPSEEQRCGRRGEAVCRNLPGPAGLRVPPAGPARAENLTEACPGAWPWQVSLQANGVHYCSAVLIRRRWVLAARHCAVSAGEDVAVLGGHDLGLSLSQSVPVDRVFDPPQEDGFPPKNDLSLLRLAVPARLGAGVTPLCVAEEDEELDDGWRCISAGWGATSATAGLNAERLHHAGVPLVERAKCRAEWGRDRVDEGHVCAHPVAGAACAGDSGAPLFCQKHGTYFLFGLLTWGSRRCDPGKPAIFSKVADYHSWIGEVTDA
ncbi:ovochymase-1 isoform X1 [Hippocampus zosterae]|uniref:ovochymase-1 isoform X1 n=1 Tax=Hippocampus zosterae TaxID=109293 RepID=UPI00223D0B60|nr:ovochymase-1 isoform X1 [Hippocampus zosterae]